MLQSLLPAADQRNITVELLLGENTVITGVRQLAYELIYYLGDNAKHAVQRLNARISLDSRVGESTVICVHF